MNNFAGIALVDTTFFANLKSRMSSIGGERYLWIAAFIFGNLLALVFIIITMIATLWALLASIFVLMLMTGIFLAAHLLRKRLLSHQYSISGKRLLFYHGVRYWMWFAGHVMVWIALVFSGTVMLVLLFGGSSVTFALTAGMSACALYSLLGLLSFRRFSLLGITWKEIDWDSLPDFWTRARTTVLLSARQEIAWQQDLKAGRLTYRRMLVIQDRVNSGVSTEELSDEIVDLFESQTFVQLWSQEFMRRVIALAPLFLLTIILTFPFFFATQSFLNREVVTLANRFVKVKSLPDLVAQKDINDQEKNNNDPQSGDSGQQQGQSGDSGQQQGQSGDSGQQQGQSGDSGQQQGQSGDSGQQQGQSGDSGQQQGQPGDSKGNRKNIDDNETERTSLQEPPGAPTPKTAQQGIPISLPALTPARGADPTSSEVTDGARPKAPFISGTPIKQTNKFLPVYRPIQHIPNWIIAFIQRYRGSTK